MKYDALIFDIDGTLWDSCEAVRRSWRQSLRRRYGCFGSPDLSQVRSIMGLGPDEIAQKLFSRFGARAREVILPSTGRSSIPTCRRPCAR